MFKSIGFFILHEFVVIDSFSISTIEIVFIWVFRQKPGESQAALLPSRFPLYLLPPKLRQKDAATTANTEKVHEKRNIFKS
jgi:hypothetical protein